MWRRNAKNAHLCDHPAHMCDFPPYPSSHPVFPFQIRSLPRELFAIFECDYPPAIFLGKKINSYRTPLSSALPEKHRRPGSRSMTTPENTVHDSRLETILFRTPSIIPDLSLSLPSESFNLNGFLPSQLLVRRRAFIDKIDR